MLLLLLLLRLLRLRLRLMAIAFWSCLCLLMRLPSSVRVGAAVLRRVLTTAGQMGVACGVVTVGSGCHARR